MNNTVFINQIRKVCGSKYVLSGDKKTARFRKGYRSGEGDALCVALPGSLLEQWKILKLCAESDKIILMQAANTGLTGGSTPNGSYDREVVIINTTRMDSIYLLDNGQQAVCLPGSTLFDLEKKLNSYGRQPHSVLGSSCVGASVVGGVCNNSGGALIERGPSYTELSVFAKIDYDGSLSLVNNLGINLGQSPEEILSALDSGKVSSFPRELSNKKASDSDYSKIVRDINAATPARYNSDSRCLHEASGCAGKLAIFAVRLDTFPKNKREQIFYIGSNDTKDFTEIRRRILSQFSKLPVSAEYMHRDIFNISEKYGKDTIYFINLLGTKKLPLIFSLKGIIDAKFNKTKSLKNFSDILLQSVSKLLPKILPKKIRNFRDRYEHHLILKMYDDGIEEASLFLDDFFAQKEGDFIICNKKEGRLAELNRFAAAGAAVRFQKVHSSMVEDILALDFSLRRNETAWFEDLPENISDKIIHKLYYGHFMCHVMHQDYVVKKGVDINDLKAEMLKILDKRGAEYPAEHNVGHLYQAKPNLAKFYKSVDPTNSMNPGLGKMPKQKNYGMTSSSNE